MLSRSAFSWSTDAHPFAVGSYPFDEKLPPLGLSVRVYVVLASTGGKTRRRYSVCVLGRCLNEPLISAPVFAAVTVKVCGLRPVPCNGTRGGLTGIMKQGDGRYSVSSSVEWASAKGTGRALGRLVRWVFFFSGIDNERSKWDAGLETRHEEELCSLDCNRHINNEYITSTRQNLLSSFF